MQNKDDIIKQIPEPPDTLQQEGRDRWYLIFSLILLENTFDTRLIPLVENLCTCYDYLKEYKEIIIREGHLITDERGKPMNNPISIQLRQTLNLIQSHLNSLGLSAKKLIAAPTTVKTLKKAASEKRNLDDGIS